MSWRSMVWSVWDSFIWIRIKLKSWIVILSTNWKILWLCHWRTTKSNFYRAINSLHFHPFNIFLFKIICYRHLLRDGLRPQDWLKFHAHAYAIEPSLWILLFLSEDYGPLTMKHNISTFNRSPFDDWHWRKSMELRLLHYSILQLFE